MKTLQDAFHGEFELHYVPDPVCHSLVMVQCSSGMLFEVDILYMFAVRASLQSPPCIPYMIKAPPTFPFAVFHP